MLIKAEDSVDKSLQVLNISHLMNLSLRKCAEWDHLGLYDYFEGTWN